MPLLSVSRKLIEVIKDEFHFKSNPFYNYPYVVWRRLSAIKIIAYCFNYLNKPTLRLSPL